MHLARIVFKKSLCRPGTQRVDHAPTRARSLSRACVATWPRTGGVYGTDFAVSGTGSSHPCQGVEKMRSETQRTIRHFMQSSMRRSICRQKAPRATGEVSGGKWVPPAPVSFCAATRAGGSTVFRPFLSKRNLGTVSVSIQVQLYMYRGLRTVESSCIAGPS